MSAVVSVQDLKKRYGAVEAVRGVSFEIRKGEIFGMLGPDGAGKTTTVECVLGLREADAGSIHVCGIDARTHPAAVKRKIGAQLQSTALQDRLTPIEAIQLFSSFYGVAPDPMKLLEQFSLGEKARAHYETLSGGQRQRLALALALVNDPEFLVLDEPTASLDPQSRRELHDVIRRMRSEGRTVLLTTHYIEEAEQLCDRIAIVDRGQVIAHGTPQELIARSKSQPTVVVHAARALDAERLRRLAGVSAVSASNGSSEISTARVGETIIELVRFLETEQNELQDLAIRKPSLEDVFIELTGRRLRD